MCDEGYGVGPTGRAVYLDFAEAIQRLGEDVIRERYGNLFAMYREITGEDPYKTPMRIYPAPHYTMGGLWVDYNLMTTIPGLYALGEANFSDHGANRLGASALMQGLADGYFIIPVTIGDFLADHRPDGLTTDHPAFEEACGTWKTRSSASLHQREEDRPGVPLGAGAHHVGQCRYGPQRKGTDRSHLRHPGAPGGVLEERQGGRQGEGLNKTWSSPAGWPTSWSWAS